MSGASKKDEAAALLKSGRPEVAYQAISEVLTEPPSSPNGRLEFELLSSNQVEALGLGDSPLVREGKAVAISKKALVLAFCVARQVLQKYRALAAAGSAASKTTAAVSADDAMKATAVLLLMHADHLTAANTRKRVLQARIREASASGSNGIDAIVAGELHFLDSILTSYLNKHTKSHTLWNHRVWLLTESSRVAGSKEIRSRQLVLGDLEDVVMVAAVRHPRNYYAWEHARWLISSYVASGGHVDDEMLTAVRDWCYRHHTDTSGWSFLLYLFFPLVQASSSTEPPPALVPETVAEVERMASSFAWTGESIWVFLRNAVAYTNLHQHGTGQQADLSARLYETAKKLQGSVGPDSQDQAVLEHAQDWCSTYSKNHTGNTG